MTHESSVFIESRLFAFNSVVIASIVCAASLAGMPARPRVVVVGAGVAGLSAALRLHQACKQAFDLTVLEGSNRIGGRVLTARLGEDQVELGATLIHGITGSPIYEIAQRIGALSVDTPREDYKGLLEHPLFCAEGLHLPIDPRILEPSIDFFRSSMALVKGKDADHSLTHTDVSVGAYLRQRLRTFLLEKPSMQTAEGSCSIQNAACEREGSHAEGEDFPVPHGEDEGCRRYKSSDASMEGEACSMWNPSSLQESAFLSLEALERSMAACDSLEDLDLASFKEYTEFPGSHITIGKGYTSVVKELENSLPSGTVKLGKKVQKIFWNYSHPSLCAPVVLQCEDGSVIQTDHAILTMSLGVLKSGVSTTAKANSPRIRRSVMDLRGWKTVNEAKVDELFEPSLPSWKRDAISCLGFGAVNKLFLVLDPAADEILLTEIVFLHKRDSETVPRWLRKAFAMFPIYKGSNVVLLWMTGDEALQMETLSDEEVLDGVTQMLASFRLADMSEGRELNREGIQGQDAGKPLDLKQRLRSMLKGVLRSKWATNPLCQGSYSFVAVGSSGRDIDDLAKPLPETSESETACTGEGNISKSRTENSSGKTPLQLLFAGEATHRSFYSTTHGAFLSGVREADRLLNYFKKGSQRS